MAGISTDTTFSFDGDPFSPRVIIITQYKRCLAAGSVEFKGGYWQVRILKSEKGVDATEKVYVPDTREVFCNTVLQLYNACFPHFDLNDEENENEEERVSYNCLKILDHIDAAEKDALTKTSPQDEFILSSDFYTETRDKIVLENYKTKNLRLYTKLFRILSRWLKDENYLDGEGQIIDR